MYHSKQTTLLLPQIVTRPLTSNWTCKLDDVDEGALFTFADKEGTTHMVRLKYILFPSEGFFSRFRGTIRVECACEVHCAYDDHYEWSGKKPVLKLSFLIETRTSEQTCMDCCEEKAQLAEQAWVLNHLSNIYWTFKMPVIDDTLKDESEEDINIENEMLIIQGSIEEELIMSQNLEIAEEYAQVFYDIAQCHYWVYTYVHILHRELNLANIMVGEKDGKKYGVLNDWDLAISLDKQGATPTLHYRTGTRPYMALEQHSCKWKGLHRYRYDLESLFYAILLVASSPSPSEECEQDSDDDAEDYCHWIDYGNRFLHREKKFIIILPSWEPTVTHFFRGFFQWLTELQTCLNHGFHAFWRHQRDEMDAAEAAKNRERKQKKGKSQGEEWQPQPQQVLSIFDEDTLGGHFSYKNMVFIMHQFCGKELETRSVEWQEMVQKQKQLQTERTGTDGMAQDG
ncbi:hypothetical protein C8J55DRAFT_484494 [Lentinula edodes]|uniref:Protein kinase domain-containing protein n=1 Tax=Lentinula lateritia TaxID=40482 RepID=A0A9W9AZZ4_9AGAR|nr:hypothetical protein C8J55DRAFT_484494 [Lentinula edodes]